MDHLVGLATGAGLIIGALLLVCLAVACWPLTLLFLGSYFGGWLGFVVALAAVALVHLVISGITALSE